MIMAPRTGYRQPQASGQGFARTKKVYGGPAVTLVAADVALNGQVAIARVPKGFVLMSLSGVIGDCDTAATLLLALGDAGNTSRLFAANAVGQAGGAVPALAAAGLLYEFPDDTDIILTSTVAATALGPTPTVLVLLEGYVR
jgi:hypothetical protein